MACSHAPSLVKAGPKKKPPKAATPAATPSSPSSRLNAFVTPTNQNNVTTTFTTYNGVTGRMAPKLTSTTPATTWKRSFTCGRSGETSSNTPTASINAALVRTLSPALIAGPSAKPNTATVIEKATAAPRAMATPPSNGVGVLLQRSALGSETMLSRSAALRARRVRSAVANAAATSVMPRARIIACGRMWLDQGSIKTQHPPSTRTTRNNARQLRVADVTVSPWRTDAGDT